MTTPTIQELQQLLHEANSSSARLCDAVRSVMVHRDELADLKRNIITALIDKINPNLGDYQDLRTPFWEVMNDARFSRMFAPLSSKASTLISQEVEIIHVTTLTDWNTLIDELHAMGDNGLSEGTIDILHDIYEYQPGLPSERSLEIYRTEPHGYIRIIAKAYGSTIEESFVPDVGFLESLSKRHRGY